MTQQVGGTTGLAPRLNFLSKFKKDHAEAQ